MYKKSSDVAKVGNVLSVPLTLIPKTVVVNIVSTVIGVERVSTTDLPSA